MKFPPALQAATALSFVATALCFGTFGVVSSPGAEKTFRSHPPLRPLPGASQRPATEGPARYVDAVRGSDRNNGSQASPWKTIAFALKQIRPGETLYLRGGVYYERVYCSVAGTAKKPITIRSFPGELAVLDGGFRAFFEDPQKAWKPVVNGTSGEFRSTRSYRNLRNLHGRFGDSLIGLQVYYHSEDLRGERYVGPGIWYNRATGHIHIRFAHHEKSGLIRGRTALSEKYLPHRLHRLESYRGETDPRKLPLIIAPFHSVPLLIDRAQHLRLQDLVIRGGGYRAVDIRHGEHITFDNVIIYAGTYGIRARNTGPFRMVHCAVYGSCPPWSTRGETSLRERPWQSKGRNLTRLNTHALLIPAAGDEYSVYYFPYNNRWEISYCEFADAHDGVYLGDIDGLKFHHNYLHNFQDDGIYLSHFRKLYYPQHGPRQIYQNVISGCIMTFAFGGDARPGSAVHVFRNILDGAAVVSDHGSPPWDSMRWYHNTILADPRFLFRTSHIKAGQTWQVFNNILLKGRQTTGKAQPGADWGGNVAGDPQFRKPGDFRLKAASPAVDAGVLLPADWPDPLRKADKNKPDAGAIPLGSDRLRVGRFGRLVY